MKLLLINPFHIVPGSWVPGGGGGEPLALEYLAAVTATKHEVRILDCVGEFPTQYKVLLDKTVRMGASPEQIRTTVSIWRPDIVGVTAPFECLINSL